MKINAIMTTIAQVEKYFIDRCNELISLSERGDPWVFLCGAAMIEYLTHMATGTSGRTAYIDFVKNYFGTINAKYKDFMYQSGEQDLPLQMYVILRCGIVHKFSFIPGPLELSNGGRLRSILIGHEKNGATHLARYTSNGMDSVIFAAEQFSKDIKHVVNMIVEESHASSQIESNIISHVKNFPPIQGDFEV